MIKLVYNAARTAYGIDQIKDTMTTGELIEWLSQYDYATPVYLSFDSGYTYGSFEDRNFEEWEADDE